VKTRIEIETGVDSASSLQAIFEMLGFRPGFRYEKYRTVWSFADATRPIVVVDETPIGLYAEIEGEEAAIRELADELGVPASSFIEESYPALWALARRIVPSRPRDMVFS
jgi:adenylate cyclase class 2